MRPAPFRYSKPSTLEQALQEIARGAVPLAGGQSLIQALRLRTAEPTAIVDINGIAELSANIECTPETVVIGALTTHRQLSEHAVINDEFPWLTKAARELGDVQVRNRGTVLGNMCWADPRANLAVALLASDAIITATDSAGNLEHEQISVTNFFTGFRRNVLGSRLATSIRLQRTQAIGSYLEFSRQPQDLPLCNVCVVQNKLGTAVAVGGVHQQPIRLPGLEQLLHEQGLTLDRLDERVEQMLIGMNLAPIEDHYGSPAFKRQLAATLIRRATGKCIAGGDPQ